jgi:malonyl-CoA O-methyltransferase
LAALQRPDGSLPGDPHQAEGSVSDEEMLLLDGAEAEWRRGNLPAASEILQVLARKLWSAATCRRFGRTNAANRPQDKSAEIYLPVPSGGSESGDKSPHSKASPAFKPAGDPMAASTVLARLAVVGYQVGLRQLADHALHCLERRQNPSGGFPRDSRGALFSHRRPEDPLAVKYYLDAAWLQVLAAFDTAGQDLPATIDPADGRIQAAADWMRRLPASARVADVGCGKGRFLKHLAAWFPGAELIGVDISKVMLAQLPPGIRALEGSLLRIPLADGELDGALAVESLEHALLPEQAVAELCRVVRPGGSVLVIDKHRAKQPLSLCDPWERWFTPQELSAWLSRWCDEVTVSPVAHLEGRPGRDLFLAATGRRRG